jgi:hypothetical protein
MIIQYFLISNTPHQKIYHCFNIISFVSFWYEEFCGMGYYANLPQKMS